MAAPLLYSLNLDLPITFLVTALLALAVNWQSNWSQRMVWIVACVAMVALTFMVRRAYLDDTTVTVRNFYASLRVKQDLQLPRNHRPHPAQRLHPAWHPDLRHR